MDPIVDTDLATRRKLRALAQGTAGADFLMRRAADDMADRLLAVSRRFADVAVLYSPTTAAAEALALSGKVDTVVEVAVDAHLAGTDARIAPADTLPLAPQSIDLAVSLLALQEANDIPGSLIQIRRALRPDGLFLGAMFGGSTLTELRQSLLAAETELLGGASPRVMPFADVRDAGALLQRAGFALPVADTEVVTVRYGDMFALLRDLRAMGATNALHARVRKPATRALFVRAAQIYQERFADADGRIRASFEFLWLSGWAPAASQPQPLKPGSGKVSLADVLGRKDGAADE